MKNPFDVKEMKCKRCRKVRRQYPNFESQWTAVSADGGKFFYFCPTCFGIPDPASAFCRENGHDFGPVHCMRCGKARPDVKVNS